MGEGEGEYTVESQVETVDGGQIDDSFSGSIREGESQTLTATVPEQEDTEGSISSSTESDQNATSDPEKKYFKNQDIPEWAPPVGGAGVVSAGIYGYLKYLSGTEEDDS